MATPGAFPAGTRKKNSGMFGHKTVTLVVGQGKETFTVLEDLVCVSPRFRDILQPHRKAIEGDCFICHDALEGDKPLTYCVGPCGNNFHQACVDEWQRYKPEGVLLHCPLCLQRLNQPRTVKLVLPAVNAKAFDVYYNWLYDQPHIQTPSKLGHLIRAYQFILKECVDSHVYLGWHDVSIAYTITSDPSPLREFLVRMYMQVEKLDRIMPKWERYPHEFHKDLAKALMQSRGRQVKHWNWECLERKVLTD
jgi:hypothetical protein